MQEALKNPHFKKIWEKVIMNRHLEAKSLEEALEREISPFNGCMVAIDLTQFGYAMSSNEPLKVVSYNKFEYFAIEPVYSKLIAVWDSCKKKVKNNAQILGRPITLEDIMMILPKTFAYWNAYNSIVDIQFVNHNHHVMGFNLQWLPSKHLHKQTPKTWEKIANLI